MKTFFILVFILVSLGVKSQNKPDTLDENYSYTSDSIYYSYVPESGKSNIIAAEMLRILFNVKDEAMRNGNMNWHREDKIGLLFIYKTLSKSEIFPFEILEEVRNDINRLLRFRRPCTDQFVYTRIERRIIEYFWNKGVLEI